MAENGNGKIPSWVWLVVVVVVGYLLLQKAEGAAKKAVGGSAKELGKGIGSGAVTSAGAALGAFVGGLFGSGKPSHETSSAFKPDTSGDLTISDGFSATSSDSFIDPDVVDE